MWFSFFKKKKVVEEPKTFEGRFVSDEDIKEMVAPKTGTFIKKEFEEIDEMMEKVRQYFE